jgi:hypothetical protein
MELGCGLRRQVTVTVAVGVDAPIIGRTPQWRRAIGQRGAV